MSFRVTSFHDDIACRYAKRYVKRGYAKRYVVLVSMISLGLQMQVTTVHIAIDIKKDMPKNIDKGICIMQFIAYFIAYRAAYFKINSQACFAILMFVKNHQDSRREIFPQTSVELQNSCLSLRPLVAYNSN